MESPRKNLGKDGRVEENAELHATESLESSQETLVPKRCRSNIVPGKTLVLSIRRSRASATCRELFLQNVHGSRNSIPKHIISFDEKYVIRCLELIRNFAVRAAARNFTSKVDILPDHTSNNLAYIENRSLSNMAIEYPIGGGSEVVVNSTGDWAIGTVSGSQTMINILKSPLLQQFGSLDKKADFVNTNLLGVSEPFYSDFAASVKAPNLEKEVKVLDHKYASAPLHRRDASMSSTNSSFSDQSSSSGYGTSFQGMLQCTWKDGLPHHVFTVDDKREVYVADLLKVESSDEKGVEYLYTFHSRRNGKKECDVHDLVLQSIAKMRVSTSIRFSSNNSEVRETQFILSISSDNHTGEMQTSNHAHKKNKGLTKKMVDVFRLSQSYKQRSSSKFGGSGAIFEDTPMDPSEDAQDNFPNIGESRAEYKHAPNLELAAIVVKDIYHHHKEAELGGWGLKFLKKSGNKPSLDTMIPSEHSRNTGECSTSTDILIPAGFHGGPRTRVGGPSSLVERWISGGHCDCGGWDVGCPLTILNTKSGSTDYSSRLDNYEECKSIDLFIQGSKQNAPVMKMVNIHRGLYYIHFQSSLSTLQCFAIAAAMIHSRSPLLRSKVYRT